MLECTQLWTNLCWKHPGQMDPWLCPPLLTWRNKVADLQFVALPLHNELTPEEYFSFSQPSLQACCGWTPGDSSAPDSRSLAPPPSRMEGRVTSKSSETCGSRYRQFHMWSKSCTCKQSKIIHLFSRSCQQAGGQTSNS